jgi:murein L,D-transpeptidase YcbB/YkuD
MKKFIVNEEEKNRILNLHKKLISEQSTSQERAGEVSASFFEQNKIGNYSEDISSAETPDSSGGKTGFRETTLTIDDLKTGRTVSMGVKGDIVGEIQQLLIDKGYKNISKSGKPDKLFGRLTKAQVEKFQTENKNDKGESLKKDGIVGPETIKALLKVPIPYTKGLETAVKQVLPTGVSPTLPSPAK